MDIGTREPVTVATRPRRRASRLGMATASALLLAVIAAIWFWPAKKPTETEAHRFGDGPVPVLVATAARQDVPIWLDALGTVQAYNTVTVKPMVNGPLTEVDFHEGQTVKRGQVLARIDPRTYQAAFDQAVAKKAQDEAQLANAKLDLARYEKLVQNKFTTGQTADTAKALVAQLTAQIEGDQAQIDNARTLLGYCTITSPLDGRTGIRQVDAGNIVQTSDTTGLVVITQLHPISVVFTLPQQDLPQVARAMRGGMPLVVAYAQGASHLPANVLDRGKLEVLDNQVDPTTGTIKLKATFPNLDDRLWPGGFVGVRLQVATVHDATVVPPSAVQRGPNGDYIYVVDAKGAAARQSVTVAHQDEDVAIVSQGLDPGQTVVTDGAARLTDGKKVSIAPEAGQPASETPSASGAHGSERHHRQAQRAP